MQVDAFAIRLRRRSGMEACDLGMRLCQNAARDVYRCYAVAWLLVTAFALSLFEFATWMSVFALWMAKPWLDRTVLFVLSRAAFGQATRVRDLWAARRQVWGSQFLRTWTLRRLSPWRSFTQPVYQLEGQSGTKLRRRVKQIRSGHSGTAILISIGFVLVESFVIMAGSGLAYQLAPPGVTIEFANLFDGTPPGVLLFFIPAAYALAIGIIEPFYVASGFALYLNRRVELEAWDIEQEFRRAFPQ